jgi:hypothetical protein
MIHFLLKWQIVTIMPVIIVGTLLFWLKFDGFSKEVDRTEFMRLMGSDLTKFGSQVFYKGRTNGSDYFERILTIGQRTKIHIPISESPINEGLPYSSDSEKWIPKDGPLGWERSKNPSANSERQVE